MKVKELIAVLSNQNPELDILCYTEDKQFLQGNNKFRLIEIDNISTIEGEKQRDADGFPTLKLGSNGYSEKHVIINLLTDF